jgi:hypothetical protein
MGNEVSGAEKGNPRLSECGCIAEAQDFDLARKVNSEAPTIF